MFFGYRYPLKTKIVLLISLLTLLGCTKKEPSPQNPEKDILFIHPDTTQNVIRS